MDATNPYDFTRPVREPSHFVGRREELRRLRAYLDQACASPPRITNLAILGPRGIGKTSLLNVARRLAEDRGFAVTAIPLDDALAASDRRLFAELFAGLGVPTPDLESNHAVVAALRAALASRAAQRQPGVAVLIDECDLLAANKILLQKIRNYFTEVDGFMLVLAGSAERYPAVAETFGPFGRFFEVLRLERFRSFEEVRECITEPLAVAGGKSMDPESLEDLHLLTEGMPFEVKLLAHYLYEACAAGGGTTLRLTTAVLDRARPRLEEFRARPIAFKTPLDDLLPEEMDLYRLMLGLPALYPNLLRLMFMFEAAAGGDWRAAEARRTAFERARLTLSRRGLADASASDLIFIKEDFARVYLRCALRERGCPVEGLRAPTFHNLLCHMARGLLGAEGPERIFLAYRDAGARTPEIVEASRAPSGPAAVSRAADAGALPARSRVLRLPGLPGRVSLHVDFPGDEEWLAGLARSLERVGVPVEDMRPAARADGRGGPGN